jgi:hypothetical protein
MALDFVSIEWVKTDLEDAEELEDAYFYAFTDDETLLYIGIACKQDVIDEIKKSIDDFGLDEEEIDIWLGFINKTTFERITEKIVKDVECLLIFWNKPEYNTQCIKKYPGRDNLMVKNQGCQYIDPCVKIKDDEISKC